MNTRFLMSAIILAATLVSSSLVTAGEFPGDNLERKDQAFPGDDFQRKSANFPGDDFAPAKKQFPGDNFQRKSANFPGDDFSPAKKQFPGDDFQGKRARFPGDDFQRKSLESESENKANPVTGMGNQDELGLRKRPSR